MHTKKELRGKAKEIRKNLDMKKISFELVKRLRQKEYYKKAKNIMLFYPLKNEVDARSLLSDDKNFYLPRVKGGKLEVCPYKDGDTLKILSFGISEPINDAVSPSILDLVIIPALAADKNNYRLGYGKGFYDKFLSQNPNLKSVVLIPEELVVDELPIEEHDIRATHLISIQDF